jgi:alpha-D-xyloside xylohydrolase
MGNNYDYEKGAFAEIPMPWNEASQILASADRKGNFPGMSIKRTFQIVCVAQGHGAGEERTQKPDVGVSYAGNATTIKVP